MDKLKSGLLNHGEKVVAVVFALLGVVALSSASWSPEMRNPGQIVETTNKSKSQIEQNQWPDEDQRLFAEISDVENMVRDNSKILTKADDFQIGPFNPSIVRLRAKRTGVNILAPESPIATTVIFALAMPPSKEEEVVADGKDETTEDGKTEEKSAEDLSDEEQIEKLIAEKFGLRPGGASGLGLGGGESSYGSGAPGSDYPGGGLSGSGSTDMSAMMEQMGGGGYGSSGYEDGASELMGSYGSEMMSVKKNIRVSAGVSVRMVVDLRKQRDILRTSLHLPSDYRVAQGLIQYVDLLVERRRKQGPNAWDEWEDVKSEDLGEILKDSFGIDRDIVSPAVTRNTITMPLPRRAAGDWRPVEASHPRVENFELSDEEKLLMDKWNQRVTEKLEMRKDEQPDEVEQKGFSQFVQSSTDAMQGYGNSGYGSGSSGYESGSAGGDDYADFASSMGDGVTLTDEERDLLDETKATADHRLLLVRFMDFTVERGFAYQYRVRLQMKNPNYNHPLDELVDAALSVESTLYSDWSEPTPETFVPVAHRTYLTGVDGRSGVPEKVGISVYTDTTDNGMPVMGNLKSVLMGLPIAGNQNIEIVDLTTEEVASKEVALRTNELLTAAQEIPRASSGDFDMLKDAVSRTRGRLVPDQICVIDGEGGLKLRSVGENGQQEQTDRMEAAAILKMYEAWKKKSLPANDFFGQGEGGGGYESGGGGLGMGSGSSSAGGYYGGGGESASGSSKSSRGKSGR